MKNEKTWVRFLKENNICHQDEVGNMPCDWGRICDKCQVDWIQNAYKRWRDKK